MAVFQEATTKKRHELEQERFRKLLDQSGDSIFVVEPYTGRFLDVNQTATRVLGYSREELLDLSLNHIEVGLPLTPTTAWHEWVQSMRDAQDVIYIEGMHRRSDGARFPVEASVGFASVGAGLKAYLGERVSFRFDARAFGTRAGDSQEDLACGVFGCFSFERASTFWQSHFVGAVMIRF